MATGTGQLANTRGDAALRGVLAADASPVRDLFRGIPFDVAAPYVARHKKRYAAIKAATPRTRDLEIGATVVLISGCQDSQLSGDGSQNGLFTEKLLEVWADDTFQGDYPSFHEQIRAKLPAIQSPNYYVVGTPNPAFEAERPFTVDPISLPIEDTSGTPADVSAVVPSVSGPSTWSRNDVPPTFHAQLDGNPYWFLEVANSPELFDWNTFGQQRNTFNWYATWEDASAEPRMTAADYELASHAWSSLDSSEQLYYRIGTTSSSDPTEWADYMVSTEDSAGASAPVMQVID